MLPSDDEDWVETICCLQKFVCIWGWGGVGVLEKPLLVQCPAWVIIFKYYSRLSLDSLNVDLYINNDLQLLFALSRLY